MSLLYIYWPERDIFSWRISNIYCYFPWYWQFTQSRNHVVCFKEAVLFGPSDFLLLWSVRGLHVMQMLVFAFTEIYCYTHISLLPDTYRHSFCWTHFYEMTLIWITVDRKAFGDADGYHIRYIFSSLSSSTDITR